MPQPPQEKKPSAGQTPLLAGSDALAASLFDQSGAARWGLSQSQFIFGLERSLRKRFTERPPSAARLEEYLLTLHLEDTLPSAPRRAAVP